MKRVVSRGAPSVVSTGAVIAVTAIVMGACASDPAGPKPQQPSASTAQQKCGLDVPPARPDTPETSRQRSRSSPTMKAGLRALQQERWAEARKSFLPVALQQTPDGPVVRAEAEYLSALTLIKDGQRESAHEALSEMYRSQEHPMRHDAAVTLCDEFGGKVLEARQYTPDDGPSDAKQQGVEQVSQPTRDQGPEQMKDALAAAETVCQDAQRCQELCRASAKSYECVTLAGKYWEGDGVPQSRSKMPEINRAACAAGNKFACALMTKFEKNAADCDDDATCTTFCDSTFYSACMRLGDRYFKGIGVPKDLPRAVSLFRKACDGGNGPACNALGFAYGRGIGVAKDWGAATTFLKKACSAGDQGACNAVPNAECIVAAKTSKQRRPGDDTKCLAAKTHRANLLIVDPKKTYVAYETPDVNTLDVCSDALKSEGCYQINIIARDTSIYCCP